MESLSHQMIGRIISVLDPKMVQQVISEYAPLSRDINIVPKVYETVQRLFPEMDEYNRMLMFINMVYRIFIPQSFLPPKHKTNRGHHSAQGKLPTGVRSVIRGCLSLSHDELVNHHKHQAEPFTKNPRYRAKMHLVLEELGLTVQNTIS